MANDFTLSFGDILKDAHHIHEYRGDHSRALSSFIREVEMILSLLPPTTTAGAYVFRRVILNKIQGGALHVVRTIENSEPSWDDIKRILIRNFGVKESYNQLYQEAFMLSNNNNITEYFKSLRSIMCKVNEKYEYDNVKHSEFSPKNVEEAMLRTFLKNIDVNLASVIINRNVKNLREAFDLLETEGLVRTQSVKTKFPQSNEKPNKTENQNYHNANNQRDRFYKLNYNNQDQNANHNNNFQNVKANSGNFRSGTQNLNSNQNCTNQQSHISKMEIDHVEVDKTNCSQFKNYNQDQSFISESMPEPMNCPCHANFHIVASKNHFP